MTQLTVQIGTLLLALAVQSAPVVNKPAPVSRAAGASTSPTPAATGLAAKDYGKMVLSARALFNQGRWAEAEPLLREVINAIDSGQHPQPGDQAKCLGLLAQICAQRGEDPEALKFATRHYSFLKKMPSPSKAAKEVYDEQLRGSALLIAQLFVRTGQEQRAVPFYKLVLSLAGKVPRLDPLTVLELRVQLLRTEHPVGGMANAAPLTQATAKAWSDIDTQAATLLKQQIASKATLAQVVRTVEVRAFALTTLDRTEDAIDVLRGLVARAQAAREVDLEIGKRRDIAFLRLSRKQFAEARAELTAALSAAQTDDKSSLAEADLQMALAGVARAEAEDAASQGRTQDAQIAAELARQSFRDAANGLELALADNSLSQELASDSLAKLNTAYRELGEYKKAVPLAERLLALHRQTLGEDHALTRKDCADLGALYARVDDYERAVPLLRQAIDDCRGRTPPQPLELATLLNTLGAVERARGDDSAAMAHIREGLTLRQANLPAHDISIAESLSNLGTVLNFRGEYSAAISQLQQALAICETLGDRGRGLRSTTLLNLAAVHRSQGQTVKAKEYCQQSLELCIEAFGPQAPALVSHYNALAELSFAAKQLDQASIFAEKSLAICQQNDMDRGALAATVRHLLARVAVLKGDFAAAENYWREAYEIQGSNGQLIAASRTLIYLADLAQRTNKPAEAEERYRQALELQAQPTIRFLALSKLGKLLTEQNRTAEALPLLRAATDGIELPRAETSGAEAERAVFFSQYATAFDLLFQLNLQQGDVPQAFQIAERGRNRTLLDQLKLAGVDLLDTLPEADRQQLAPRQQQLSARLNSLKNRLASEAARQAPRSELAKITSEVVAAQSAFAELDSEIRDRSPLYHQLRANNAAVGSLSDFRKSVLTDKNLLLFYHLGNEYSYLLVLGKAEDDAHVYPLELSPELAEELSSATETKFAAGPLTRSTAGRLVTGYIAQIRNREGARAIVGREQSPKGALMRDQAAALAEILLPPAVRELVQKRAPKYVVIVPDGDLHRLPFEALVLSTTPEPRFLLDEFPPITYSPSATMLANLQARPGRQDIGELSVLSVGNPEYANATSVAQRGSTTAALLDAFIEFGGQLPTLPGTADECRRVLRALGASRVKLLEGPQATERNVRQGIDGMRFVHIAAHGLVDQEHENLFGAIALTPELGSAEDNDGFLSLHEIFALSLTHCELAVLSACQTNVGPERPMESGSTLAQAFLSAGARRVISSHWNVDDASTAELMGTFFDAIAAEMEQHEPISFAAALNQARKKIRSRPEWNAPYYWAPFVLVGPAE